MKYKFTIVCANQKKGNAYIDATLVSVYATSPKGALQKTRNILKRKHYFIRDIGEEVCLAAQERALDKLIKAIKGLK